MDKEVSVDVAIIIPARYASSRLPGKPLLKETGKYLIQHVYEQAAKTRAAKVIVATDDERIATAVKEFGGIAAMTRANHQSGTDRVAEVAGQLDAEIIINLQGDEPLLDPQHLQLLANLLQQHQESTEMATLAVPLQSHEEFLNPNCVKVVCDANGRALYFSRSPIPCVRDGQPNFARSPSPFLRHVGIYAYRRDFLLRFAAAPPEPLEQLEKLEQLRALSLGATIRVGVVNESSVGVDTPDDYARFVQHYRQLLAFRGASIFKEPTYERI